jgi:hypothetical protein
VDVNPGQCARHDKILRNVLLDVEVVGARQAKQAEPDMSLERRHYLEYEPGGASPSDGPRLSCAQASE